MSFVFGGAELAVGGVTAGDVRGHLAGGGPAGVGGSEYRSRYLLCNGCGDDSFMDFRAWLIGQGHAVSDRVISDPDSLADLVGLAGDADSADAERFGGLVDEVYEQMTGTSHLPPSRFAGPGKTEPSGESMNVDDEQIARSHFPRLAEHYYSERARRYG